ncbi:MAG: zinc ribbon domain-containing protein [Schwartzia sp.]|nr:zinc ribbon domain-containing protein [Schwartzia sp. (in: firmicutes)]
MVQEKMKKNKKRPGAFSARQKYLLSGYVFCDQCGAAMSGQTTVNSKGVRTRYYRCGTAARGGKAACPCRAINADQLEALVMDKIKELVSDDKEESLLDMIAKTAYEEYHKLQKSKDDSYTLMKRERDKQRAALDRFYDRIREGDEWDEIDEAEFKNTKAKFRAAETGLAEIRARDKLPEVTAAQVKEYVHRWIGDMIKEEGTENFRALLENFVDSIRISPENVAVRFKVYLDWCARRDSNARPSV